MAIENTQSEEKEEKPSREVSREERTTNGHQEPGEKPHLLVKVTHVQRTYAHWET
jgi:hypothetical protein